MDPKQMVVLVTGANRGIGRALVQAFHAAGAARIYAAARDAGALGSLPEHVVPLALDIRDDAAVAAAAARAGDVNVLVNNAGLNHKQRLVGAPSLDAARDEMETNYFGTLRMCRAFAPILGRNGGGALVNILSLVARVNLPSMGSMAASKAAALSLTQGVRAEFARQKTLVVGVLPAGVETDMGRDFQGPKIPPEAVAADVLRALTEGIEDVYPGDLAAHLAGALARDAKAVEREFAAWV